MKRKLTKKHLIMLLLVLLLIPALYPLFKEKESFNEMKYTEFLSKMEQGEVVETKSASVDGKILIVLKSGETFQTDHPMTDTFKEMLLLNDVKVEAKSDFDGTNFIPFIYLFFLGFIVYRSMKGPKNQINMLKPNELNEDFNLIAGNQESKEEMLEVINFLKNPKKYEDMGAKMMSGVIIVGPPGTGKTKTAKAMAGEAGVPFFYANGSDFINMFVGKGANHVRGLYKRARKNSPCIVFIDEIDAVAKKRGRTTSHDEGEQTVNALLSELDGFNKNKGVITIVATNRIEMLDDAFMRPGRFDKMITIGLPTLEDRKNIIELYLKGKKIDETVNIETLSKDTFNQSGAFIENFVNQATLEAVRRDSTSIGSIDFDKALDKILLKGNPRNKNDRSDLESKMIAVHESGHVLIAKLIAKMEVRKVTTISSTSGAEGFALIPPIEQKLRTKEMFENDIRILMGGRVAEHIYTNDFNKVTTGASADIQEATEELYKMYTMFGFDEHNKFINLHNLGFNKDKINQQLIDKSQALYQETYEFLEKNKELLLRFADELHKKETLNAEEIDALLI